MIKVDIYDSEIEHHVWICYIENAVELGRFISEMTPDINLNKIPIKKWFVYSIDDSGDNNHEQIFSLEEYKQEKIQTIISLVKFLGDVEEIENKPKGEVR